ncbi:MAG: type IV secretion system protein VirB9 [Rickettsiales bacterium]|jgi:type IV secretion system protein VirB9
MKKLALIFLLISAFFTHNSEHANASQLPRYLGKEKKFRMFIYNPYDVYRYIGNYNYHGFIEFQGKSNRGATASGINAINEPRSESGQAEQISEVAIGNSDAWLWKISESKKRLYLKPVSDNANTNMTVKTNLGRIYNFELIARTPTGPDDENLIYAVKFVYPDDSDKNIFEFPKTPVSDEPDMRNLSIYNFNYEYTGAPTISPMKVFDNGEFTYFQFAAKSAELPAIFAVDADGYESLVNFRVAGEYIIVERTGAQFTLRNGNQIACVYNNNMLRSGRPVGSTPYAGSMSLKSSSRNRSSQIPKSQDYSSMPPSSPMSPNGFNQ